MFGYDRTMTDAVALADFTMALDEFTPRRRTGELAGDRSFHEQTQCERCGNPGHEYRAYERNGRHRAVTICRGCKTVREV
jgi:hypothetical protein